MLFLSLLPIDFKVWCRRTSLSYIIGIHFGLIWTTWEVSVNHPVCMSCFSQLSTKILHLGILVCREKCFVFPVVYLHIST